MKKVIVAIALVACLAPAAFFAVRWQGAETRLRAHREWSAFLADSVRESLTFPRPPDGPEGRDSLYWQWVATGAQLQSRRWQQAVRHWVENRATLLDAAAIELLKRDGLTDPPRQLRDSLVAHPELIPYEGVQGGTMFFLPDEAIVLLEPPYAFARFEDGHIGGSMLVAYAVENGPEPRVLWKVLWAGVD
jgi:hypothetical protein